MRTLRIGTRGSSLALAQSNLVADALRDATTGLQVKLVRIQTAGDRKQGTREAEQTDKKDWIRELELALVQDKIDIAVHSGKDVPGDLEPGTFLQPILKREDPSDVFIGAIAPSTGKRKLFRELPQGATVGTGSLRRKALLLRLRPDLTVVPHRGNVHTRLRKLDESKKLSGIVVAAAGLKRLGIEFPEEARFTCEEMVPALNQGILVAQCREGKTDVTAVLRKIVDEETEIRFHAERACSEFVGGDCHSAVGIHATLRDNLVSLVACVLTPDGATCLTATGTAPADEASALGKKAGENLLAQGAAELLRKS